MVDNFPRMDFNDNLYCCRDQIQTDMAFENDALSSRECCRNVQMDMAGRDALISRDCCPTLGPPPTTSTLSSLQQCKNTVTSLSEQVNTLNDTLNTQNVSVNIVPPVFQKPSETELVSVKTRINKILNEPSFGKRPGGGIPIRPGGNGGKGKGSFFGIKCVDILLSLLARR